MLRKHFHPLGECRRSHGKVLFNPALLQKLFDLFLRNLSMAVEIAFVADQHYSHLLMRVRLDLLEPVLNVIE